MTTSRRRPSVLATGRSRSRRKTLVETRPHASRHTLAAADPEKRLDVPKPRAGCTVVAKDVMHSRNWWVRQRLCHGHGNVFMTVANGGEAIGPTAPVRSVRSAKRTSEPKPTHSQRERACQSSTLDDVGAAQSTRTNNATHECHVDGRSPPRNQGGTLGGGSLHETKRKTTTGAKLTEDRTRQEKLVRVHNALKM